MGKFIITEEERNSIKKLYLMEQSNIKIKVTGAKDNMWYKNLVGKEFMVKDNLGPGFEDFYKLIISDDVKQYLTDPNNTEHYFHKKDCQVVP